MRTETVHEPRVLDTYALVYAFGLLALVPGLLLAARSGYKSYSPFFLAAIFVPFAVGMLATFLTDSAETIRDRLIRFAVLIPLVSMTGVALLFGSSIALVPLSRWIRVENFSVLSVISIAFTVAVLAPLVVALLRRIVRRNGVVDLLQSVALVAAIALAAGVTVVLALTDGVLGEYVRKDLSIYLVGAIDWYLPAFGMAAGIWRRVGLV